MLTHFDPKRGILATNTFRGYVGYVLMDGECVRDKASGTLHPTALSWYTKIRELTTNAFVCYPKMA